MRTAQKNLGFSENNRYICSLYNIVDMKCYLINKSGLSGLLLLSLCVAFSSCDGFSIIKEDKEPEARLEVYPNRETLRADQDAISVTVFSSADWTVTLSDPSWGEVTELTKGEDFNGSFKVSFAFNNTAEPRTNTLIVSNGKLEEKKTITQSGLDDYFSPSCLTLSGLGTASVSFLASAAWTASVVEGEDWCVLKTTSGKTGNSTLSCSAASEWIDVGSREALVRITMNGQSLDLTVVQGQKDVIYINADDALEFDFDAQSFELKTHQNVSYRVSVSDPSWIQHTGTRALNESALSFTLLENPAASDRTGEIQLVCESDPSVNAAITLTQHGRDPILDQTVCGCFGVGGRNIVFGQDGWNQLSRVSMPDGTTAFRLMDSSVPAAAILTGFPGGLAKGDTFPLHLALMERGFVIYSANYTARVIYMQEPMVWLRCEGSDSYFIIKR